MQPELDVTVQGKRVNIATGNAATAAIDTGTTLIGGPSDDVKSFWAAVPGSQSMGFEMEGYYSFRMHPRSTKCVPLT
jgi:cathepsin D